MRDPSLCRRPGCEVKVTGARRQGVPRTGGYCSPQCRQQAQHTAHLTLLGSRKKGARRGRDAQLRVMLSHPVAIGKLVADLGIAKATMYVALRRVKAMKIRQGRAVLWVLP